MDYSTFELGNLQLQSGFQLKNAQIAYQTYGTLNAERSNVIVYPTSYGAQHTDIEWLIASEKILDPDRYFIVIPNMFTNGLSTSPSNVDFPYDAGRFPLVTPYDNVMAQRRLLHEQFDVDKICLVYGWSMGAQQAYHWGALFPDAVERICALCGSARTSPHNLVFLEGVIAALTADPCYRDGWFQGIPERGLRAMSRVYAGWALSQRFYREETWRELGYQSIDDFLIDGWEGNFRPRHANDLLAQLRTWQHCDLSRNERFNGDLSVALASIKAKTLIMPGTRDLYFRVADNALEMAQLGNAELAPIDSVWGHRAGNPVASADDLAFIRSKVRALLDA
jgi:homoserine O-acetyltransferase